MKKWPLILYSFLILGFSGQSLILNISDLIKLNLPKYYINPLFLSGTLLLYDRPMFFETRLIEVKEKNENFSKQLDYDLSTPYYTSYLERRLFRMSTNEFPCGGDKDQAFEELFCNQTLAILSDKNIESISVKFIPFLKSGKERTFFHECKK